MQVATPAFAQTLHFDVPAQPAASGIKSFAKQAGIQILVSGDVASGKTLNRVQGDLDARAALDRLIAGTGLKVQSFDGSTAVLAQDAPASRGASNGTAGAVDERPANLDTISVVAPGSTRQVQSVSNADILAAAPGTSALKVLDRLPGVNFQSADPWGAYEWSTQITLHGFDQSRLGFTLDGIPLGNMSYATTDGLQVTRAISSDNVASVVLAQGAGALGTASNTNLGGTVQYFSADPDAQMGARLNQTAGSDGTTRTFVRFDTGAIGGFSMYGSLANADTGKWKGSGDQQSLQANLKAVYQWSEDNRISLFYDYSDRHERDYMDLSLNGIKALGWNWDYYAPNAQTATQVNNALLTALGYNGYFGIPATAMPAVLGGVGGATAYDALLNQAEAAYYLSGAIRKDSLVGLSGQFNVGFGTLNLGSYYHSDRGEGMIEEPGVFAYTSISAYDPDKALAVIADPFVAHTTDYGLDRGGGTVSLRFSVGDNDIEIGGWGESANNNISQNWFTLPGAYNSLVDLYDSQTPYSRIDFMAIHLSTKMIYAQDTLHLLDGNLTVDFGAKALDTNVSVQQMVAAAGLASGNLTARKNFLPQAGVDYRIDAHQDVYASYTKNLKAYDGTQFEETQQAFDDSKSALKPETSQTFELGYRVHEGSIEASADAYFTRFDNRQLFINPCGATQTICGSVENVGSVRSKGVDLAVIWKPAEHIRWLNTVSYDSSKYQNDYEDSGQLIQTAGKYVIATPSWMYTSAINYTIGGWRLDLDGKYTGRRYMTYENDLSVPGYWIFDFGANYDFGRVGAFKNVSLGLNVTNVFNKRYAATICENTCAANNANDAAAWTPNLLAGAPLQAFANLNVRF